MLVGCDETFRWRRNVGDRVFYRFWGQALRHVARKPAPGGQESWIEAEPRRVEPGRPVTIDVYAVDESHEPLDQPSVSVAVSGPEAPQTVSLERFGERGAFSRQLDSRAVGRAQRGIRRREAAPWVRAWKWPIRAGSCSRWT